MIIMTIQQIMRDMKLSRYQVSKVSGISWETLTEIYNGKLPLNQCNEEVLSKLSQVLELSREDLLELEPEQESDISDGKPEIKTYLETGLTESLQMAIDDYQQGEKENVLHLDCLWSELYGSINADLWACIITDEQARYLRDKYLGI